MTLFLIIEIGWSEPDLIGNPGLDISSLDKLS